MPPPMMTTSVRAFARIAAKDPNVDLVIAGGLQDDYAARVKSLVFTPPPSR